MQIASLLTNYYVQPTKKRTSERAEIIKDLYQIYTSESERLNRKKENWKRYISYLQTIQTTDSEKSRSAFKRSKTYIKEIGIKGFCYFLSHIPTKDLYYVKSVMQDRVNRCQNASMWLFANLKQLSPLENNLGSG